MLRSGVAVLLLLAAPVVFGVPEERKEAVSTACSDAVFLRRVYLDLVGELPDIRITSQFLKNDTPDKREKLVNRLLRTQAFADCRAMRWFDLLRVKSEFPCNLWPNAVQAYAGFIQQEITANTPYDEFASKLLLASGSNFRDPAVNFYRALQIRQPETIAAFAMQVFLGEKADEAWSPEVRKSVPILFSKVGYVSTGEWKEELVYFDRERAWPAGAQAGQNIRMPEGGLVNVAPEQDPREAFTIWLTQGAGQRAFAATEVKRIYRVLMGQSQPNTDELKRLVDIFIQNKFDVKAVYRAICLSPEYQGNEYAVRQIDAEVLDDILVGLFGGRQSLSSQVPEPFTFVPTDQKTVLLADGSITSPFLEAFGRPPRDSGELEERQNMPNPQQRILLLNSRQIQNRINNRFVNNLMPPKGKQFKDDEAIRAELIDRLYLRLLCRYPTEQEKETVEAYFKDNKLSLQEAGRDVAWALVNSAGFLFKY